jgi:hypothetical protein
VRNDRNKVTPWPDHGELQVKSRIRIKPLKNQTDKRIIKSIIGIAVFLLGIWRLGFTLDLGFGIWDFITSVPYR